MSVQARCSICKKPLTNGEIGGTCSAHIGKIRLYANVATAIPEGFIGMSKVCRAFEKAGFTTRQIVAACGSDACTTLPLSGEDPKGLFYVTYVGSRKFLHPDIMTKGIEMLKKAAAVEPAAKAKALPAKSETKELAGVAAALQTAVVKTKS
jgi:hypothetical protein